MKTTSAEWYLSNFDLKMVAQAITKLSEMRENPDRLGGVLTIAVIDPDDPHNATLATRDVGKPGLKVTKYGKNAAEKIYRLNKRRTAGNINETFASQSADTTHPDEDSRTWGGCVFFTNKEGQEIYIALSGAPPEVDEAIAFALGQKLGLNCPKPEIPLVDEALELLEHVITWD